MTWTAEDRRRVRDAAYRKTYNYKRYRGIPTSLVPADPAAQHAQRLLDLGWSANALERMTTGVTSTTILNLTDGRHPTIERATARAILDIPYTLAPSQSVHDEALIPAVGAGRRVKALMRRGWNHAAMQDHCGMNTTHLARGTYAQMLARRWRVIDAMFTELSMSTGPSNKTARRAAVAQFPQPLAWNDIDDPDETPTNWEYQASNRADILRDLDASRAGVSEACRRLKLSRAALQKWCGNHDMSDLYRRLVTREQYRPNGSIGAS